MIGTLKQIKLASFLGLVIAFALVIAACGGGSSSSSKSEPEQGSPEEKPAAGQSEAVANKSTEGSNGYKVMSSAELFNGAAGAGKPPKSAPAPAKGTDVWWISCGQAAEACSIPTHAAEVAAKKLGWEFHIADGRFDENGGYLSAVRTAVAANPDAIVIDGLDCPAAEAALEEAKAQHIVLMGLTSNDCSSSGGPELFSAEMKYGENATSVSEFNKSWGERAASYLIEATGGQAKVINEEGTSEGLEQEVSAAFLGTLEQCAGCEVVDTLKFQESDLVPNGPLAHDLGTALVQHPEATAIFAPYTPNVITAETAKSVESAGLSEKLVSCCGTTEVPVLALIEEGKWPAALAQPWEYAAWAMMDNLNRVLNGAETVPEGLELLVSDKTHNKPAPGEEFQPSSTWEAEFENIWKEGKG